MEGTTKRLAELVTKIHYKDLPQGVVNKGKECILDTLGCVMAGCREEESQITLKYVEERGGKPEATILGFGRKTSMTNAALVNGTLAHASDYDETVFSIVAHPSPVILPAVLSLGEKIKSSGEEILGAFLVGYELTCKVGRRIMPDLYKKGGHSTSILGVLGAAVATGRLLKLDANGMTSAIGIAASLASGLGENFGTMTKPLHAGRAAEGGLISSLLAKDGFTASQRILESKRGFCDLYSQQFDLDGIVESFGNPYEMVSPGVFFKLYPAGYVLTVIIEATRFLVESHNIRLEDVESIDCGVSPTTAKVCGYSNPQTGLEAKFSLPYAIVTYIVYRKASLEEFTDKKVQDPRIQALIPKVKITVYPELDRKPPPVIITIQLKGGQKYTQQMDTIKGSPEKPLSWDELSDKYRSCAELMLDKKNIEESIKKVLNFDRLENVSELIGLMVKK